MVDAGLVGDPLHAASGGFGDKVDEGTDGGAQKAPVAEHDSEPVVDVDLEAFEDGFEVGWNLTHLLGSSLRCGAFVALRPATTAHWAVDSAAPRPCSPAFATFEDAAGVVDEFQVVI